MQPSFVPSLICFFGGAGSGGGATAAAGAAETCTGGGGQRTSPCVDHGHAALDDVVEVEDELAVLVRGHQLEQVDQVGAEQLRGLGGQPARQVGVAEDRSRRCR